MSGITEVTASNFDNLVPQIEDAIKGAAYISLDTEFTGLIREPDLAPTLFDSPDARYQKLRQTVSSYIICQLGLSAFTPITGKNEYRASVFNFYLCPRSFGIIDPQFSIQSSSIEFLCQNDFDFNKFFYQGVPYVNSVERDAIDQFLENVEAINYPDEKRVQEVFAEVRKWKMQKDSEDTLRVNVPNGTNGQLLAADLRTRFPGLSCDLTPSGCLLLTRGKVTAHDKSTLRDSLVGFTRVFDTLTTSKKPLVGHNLFLDLLLMFHQFHEPLPKSYSRFKAELHALFPVIYDTKHMSLSLRQEADPWIKDVLRAGDLVELYHGLSGITAFFSPQISGGPSAIRAHEAGCDAYATGVVFLKLAHLIATHEISPDVIAPVGPPRPLQWRAHSAAVRQFANRVNLIRAQSHHVSLEGSDPALERPPWLCVETLNGHRSLDDLSRVLARCGAVDIRQLSKSCLLVATGNYGCARDLVSAFRDDKEVRVTKYRRSRRDHGLRAALWSLLVVSATLTSYCVLKLKGTSLAGLPDLGTLKPSWGFGISKQG
ncbi:pre-piRNA 3'-exonuclease trimmer-like [Ornithodoros turicata]|uniref:pre-piRNA 3'-exonuclease trimmer-like n=1 Tax=Ornithodoros turicata TaxID=34597 RepID=UPI00313A454B